MPVGIDRPRWFGDALPDHECKWIPVPGGVYECRVAGHIEAIDRALAANEGADYDAAMDDEQARLRQGDL